MADTVNWIQAVHQQEREAQITKSSTSTWPTSGLGFTPAAAAGITQSLRSTTPCTLATIDEEFEDSPLTKAEASLFTKILRKKLVDIYSEVHVVQNDPSSPLYSATTFEELNLHPNLLKGIYSMKFSKPSKIQEKALPLLLADPPQNLIAQSQSGTGKTAAFVLAMLTRVDASKPYPQILCLSPTFDLAQQTGKVLQQMAQYFPEIKMKYAVRGSRVFQHRLSNEKVTEHILIGTAGTTLDWAVKYRVFDPKLINMFVLDEGDVMIDTQGQQDQTIRLHRLLRTDCQNVLFSATYSEEVISFANKIISDPNIIRLRRSEESLDNIKQYYVWCTAGDEGKYTALTNIYGVLTIGQCIVFCRTRKSAIWLAGKMNKDGHAVALLTGQSNVEQRIAVLNRFREGSERLLITTNLCARGIDIDQVTLVVNYDIPVDVNHEPDCETYLHRIGRSGRFGKSGLAINFVDSRKAYDNLMSIQNHFKRVISELDTDDPDEIEKLQN